MPATLEHEVSELSELSEQDYGAALDRLRNYRSQLVQADGLADRGSLKRAADLELLYQAMRWVDEVPAPKNTVWRGRPVDPRSRNRFAGWVLQKTGLNPSRVRQLHNARELADGISATGVTVIPDSEGALRPLGRLKRAGYGDRIPDVYKRALELADGAEPTSRETNQAVRDYLAQFKPPERRSASAALTLAKRQQSIRDQFIMLLGADAETAGLTLNTLIDLYNEQVKK